MVSSKKTSSRKSSRVKDDEICDSLTQAEVRALWQWTGDSYDRLVEDDIHNWLNSPLKSGLQKMPNFAGRLQRFDSKDYNYKVGDIVTFPALTSFCRMGSSLEETRGEYSKIRYIIENGRGKRLLLSYKPQEKEVILFKGTKCIVIAIEKVKKEPYAYNKSGVLQKVIYLKQV